MHKLGIVIPAVNCLEYSKQTIASIKTQYSYQIIFVDNGSTDGTKEWLEQHPEIISYINPIVSGLAEAWNIAIQRAFDEGCDLVAVLNNDIVLAPNTLDNMIAKMETGKYLMVTGVNDLNYTAEEMLSVYKEYDENEPDNEHEDFSCFMIDKTTIDEIGWFDPNYMVAYFEDNDYSTRIAFSDSKRISSSTTSATYFHWASKTVQENPQLQSIIHDAFRHNLDFFVKKWGCEPLGDKPEMRKHCFNHPFNIESRDIKNVEPYFSL